MPNRKAHFCKYDMVKSAKVTRYPSVIRVSFKQLVALNVEQTTRILQRAAREQQFVSVPYLFHIVVLK
jgi:hypothetical protein